MRIERDTYLQKLNASRFNGLVKVVTGIRRAGKSYLLFKIFRDHLIADGVPVGNIIEVALDDDTFESLRNPEQLSTYLRTKIADDNQNYYVFLDEVQYAITEEEMRRSPRSTVTFSAALRNSPLLINFLLARRVSISSKV
jgi:predicted AAA+ superfamily ATPase